MRRRFQAQVTSGTTDSHTLFRTLKMLEEEEPQLLAESREDQSLVLSVMGKIQLECLPVLRTVWNRSCVCTS